MRTQLLDDPCLEPYRDALAARAAHAQAVAQRLTGGRTSLADFAGGHTFYGLHRDRRGWVLREWAPAAAAVSLIGEHTDWRERTDQAFSRVDEHGTWALRLPAGTLRHEALYRLRMHWPGGEGDRIPAYARRVVQDAQTGIFNAQVWAPAEPYRWRHAPVGPPRDGLLVYEAHVGMAQDREGIGTYDEFRRLVLPRVVDAGYNTLQLMALMEHPYYASFGYHVSSYFAPSSRFGTPDELKALIDDAHGAGLAVIMDLVHSHAARNEVEGLGRFDGTVFQFFHEGPRGEHPAWGSLCFDYGKPGVLHFLLSNCRYWLDAFRVDGFRFDGVTSMLYRHHGLGAAPSGYADYFDASVDQDALAYLALANRVVHAVRPDAATIAEDVSGMPGLAAPEEEGGCGFDYRLAMGVPDCWFKLANDVPDEQWDLAHLWHELTNRRREERTISYVESHDQSLVGGKTMIFELIDAPMYEAMRADDRHLEVERGVALHKMMRLATLASAGHGYLNFMGNEFGHPEWVDFPREGNAFSYRYARRQWHLRDDPGLKYGALADFDRAMLALARETGLLEGEARRLWLHSEDKILAWGRAGLMFAFNFHPSRSAADYAIETLPGTWRLVLDTDEERFAGQGRLAAGQRHHTQPLREGSALRHRVMLYLPSRTALVLCRESVRS